MLDSYVLFDGEVDAAWVVPTRHSELTLVESLDLRFPQAAGGYVIFFPPLCVVVYVWMCRVCEVCVVCMECALWCVVYGVCMDVCACARDSVHKFSVIYL